jgi:probable rRNA maturation factor
VILDAIRAALEAPPVKPLAGAELSILLTGDEEIRTINAAWRGQDKATNVLSFPAAPPGRISASPVLGDIALAYETLAREAQEQDKPLDAHLAHLVIHGLYHLLGDDHETQAEAEVMEAREIAALARLGLDNPYHEPLDAARAS